MSYQILRLLFPELSKIIKQRKTLKGGALNHKSVIQPWGWISLFVCKYQLFYKELSAEKFIPQ